MTADELKIARKQQLMILGEISLMRERLCVHALCSDSFNVIESCANVTLDYLNSLNNEKKE